MAVNVEKQIMSLNKNVSRGSEVTWIEQDILVPDTKPDVMKIVQVEAVPFVGNADTIDGGIRVTGEITYYVIYRAMDESKTKGITMTYPFSKTINVPEIKKGMNARVTAETKNLPNVSKTLYKVKTVFILYLFKWNIF